MSALPPEGRAALPQMADLPPGSPRAVFVRSSLIRTADHNYLLSRHAFLHGLSLDGFWLAAQAAEKYLKAALLLNGKDTRFYRHDLVDLWKVHAALAGPFMPERFLGQQRLGNAPLAGLSDQRLGDFVRYLARFGSPDNRYQLVGYIHDNLVLPKIDQLMFFVRRTCRDLAREGPALHSRGVWKLSDDLPLEQCAASKDHELRAFFLKDNSFWASVLTGKPAFSVHKRKLVFQAGSLQVAIAAARRLGPDAAKPAVIDLLRWLLRNVRLGRADQSRVRSALRRLTSAPARKEGEQEAGQPEAPRGPESS